MKKKLTKLIGVVLLLCFILIVTIDFILNELSKNQEVLIKILEILFASSAAFSLSFSLSITVNTENRSTTAKNNGLDKGDLIQQTGNGSVAIDKSIHNDPESLVKAVKECLIPYQQENIESIAKKTYESLQKEKPGQPLDKDFVLKYLSESSTISNVDIQDIWVKLLVQENKSSGSISKRTLDIVKNLSSDEAILFQNVAKFSLSNGVIHKELIKNIPFIDISKLQDIGLLKSNTFLSQHYSVGPNSPCSIIEAGILLSINTSGNNNDEFNFSCEMLTSEGLELKKALNIELSSNDFLILGRQLKADNKKQNLSFAAYKINYIFNNQINYQNNDLL